MNYLKESLNEFLKENDITHKEWEKMCANVKRGIEEGFPFQCHSVGVIDVSNMDTIRSLKFPNKQI